MKKIFLVGYYGHNNLGDEMLFESMLEMFKEIKFEGKIYVISDKTKIEKEYKFKVFTIDKYDFPKIINTIKDIDLMIYGGGNLLQSETSLKSFLYYDFLFSIAKHYKKNILFVSQGFGHFKHKYALKRLKKILKYKRLFGILRDETSYRYAKRYSGNFELGTDIGVIKYKNIIFKKDPQKMHISIIIKNRRNWAKILYILEQINVKRITPIVLNKSQDSIIAYEFFEKYKDEINISFPVSEENKILYEILKSEFVISDRLHGGILSLYLGVPVIMYKNQKNYRVFKTINNEYNLFFKDEEDLIGAISKIYDFKFNNMQEKFVNNLNETHEKTVNLIKTFL
ncbi:polysaccharide pyruvyl transferase CsaB [Marinitoga hydrogenitolerans DSM 16785]|uniref:Polysaccharide pyruvyl transferase CsaB n=1 Tax=Marinitoga hydrogenitolerans (strain DSM 16785 / JCM 12826 / AT1271) TaxID=1122195 RepID=A0A1M4UXI3_MARH1|nr:polysaccharide pyruvyl transferase family protein [Marinitoga hydrogenitolerans]SHE61426.1 polysaccharide pyruvyl transferase CsaB [Marinitoga hydrogenitolerans DSM 16785]